MAWVVEGKAMKRQVIRSIFMRTEEIPLEVFEIVGDGTLMSALGAQGRHVAANAAKLAKELRIEGFESRVDLPSVYGLPFTGGIKIRCRVDVILGGGELTTELRKRLEIV
jgi:hypothetical protein